MQETKQAPARSRHQQRPLIGLMSVALFCICAALLAATAWTICSSREIRLREAEVATENMARTLASQADTAIKIADVILDDIVERSERDGSSGEAGKRLAAYLMRLTRKVTEIHGLFIYDETGAWKATSLGVPFKGDNSDRDYFVFHKANPQTTTHISAPVRSRSTGHWIIPVSRRIDHADGSFAGVALATLRLDSFERVFDSLNLGKSGTVFFALENGTLIYRRPFQEKLIGTDLSSGAIMRSYRENGRAGTVMRVAKIDGIERLYSYRRLDSYPIIVSAALSKQDIFFAMESGQPADPRRRPVRHRRAGLVLPQADAPDGHARPGGNRVARSQPGTGKSQCRPPDHGLEGWPHQPGQPARF